MVNNNASEVNNGAVKEENKSATGEGANAKEETYFDEVSTLF